jgi:hypothetical protein
MPQKKATMRNYASPRTLISNDENEVVIYGADNFSQYPTRTAAVSSRCDRALASARSDDLVVLRGELNEGYHRWLRGLGLGTDHVVAYNQPATGMTLSELIVQDPEPVKRVIAQLDKKPVYVPWFSTEQESMAAATLGAELFGANASETLRYNDKAKFKKLCMQMDIPVVDGTAFVIDPTDRANYSNLECMVNQYGSTHEFVILRGTLGESGMSLYKTRGTDLVSLYRTIVASGEKVVLIEPFLDVSSSPNDQWIVDRNGCITHLGMLEQECRHGMVHVGNLKGGHVSADVYDCVTRYSYKIVSRMAASGYCGVVGIDYIVSGQGIFPVENNARFNGSSYVNIAVHNIEEEIGPVALWKFVKINVRPCDFSELIDTLSPLLYDGLRANSVFPLNCDELSESGVFAVVILGETMDDIESLERGMSGLGVTRR